MSGTDCQQQSIKGCNGGTAFHPTGECSKFNAEPWCPETIKEAKQVFSNLAINYSA